MAIYSIGEVIRRERIRQHITQEDLSSGICSTSWLSKIESGSVTPQPQTFELLIKRLGKNVSQYIQFRGEIEIDIENLKFEIRRAKALKDNEKARSLYQTLVPSADDKNILNQQFLLLYDVLLLKGASKDYRQKCDQLYKALEMTIPNFQPAKLHDLLLSQDEIIILNNLAINHYRLDEKETAKSILKELAQYLEKPNFDYEEKRRAYPIVCYNLSKWAGLDGDTLESIRLSNKVIDFCIIHSELNCLPEALFNKGYALAHLGSIESAKESFMQSHYLFKTLRREDEAQRVIHEMTQTWNIPI
jgi:transcriptional regulator with XRE-family HTH domain